jgi:ABC-type antimicrobial peptide transport system permease subunit
LLSDDLKDIVDKDDVLGGYVIPLLASKDKNSLMAKASAATLNGYAQIADSIAAYKNIKLKSSIGNEGKVTGTIWKVFMYTMVVTGIVLYVVIIMREKKYKKLAKEEDKK